MLDGPFVLRDGLDAPGRYPIGAAVAEVAANLREQAATGAVTEDYVNGCLGHLGKFERFAAAHGVVEVAGVTPNLALFWILAPRADGKPYSANTHYLRRSVIWAWFETMRVLGITDANPARVVDLPKRPTRTLASARDQQVALMRASARRRINDTSTPVLLALSISCATPAEQVGIDLLDVDVENRRIWVDCGGYRPNARWLPLLDDWCAQVVYEQVDAVRNQTDGSVDGVPLLIGRFGDRLTTSQVGKRIRDLSRVTGADKDGDVSVEGLREWGALKVWSESGSLETVAQRLGMASLDAVAHLVGYDWRSHADQAPAHRRLI